MASGSFTFMCLKSSHGNPEKSFEEVRIEDYLKAYTTTGSPPQPCPQQPSLQTMRVSLGLPPLFEPYTDAVVTPPGPATPASLSTSFAFINSSLTRSNASPPTRASGTSLMGKRRLEAHELPEAQAFTPTPDSDGSMYHNISAMPEYTNFSFEELRYLAYLKGHKVSPTPIPMYPPLSSSNSTTAMADLTPSPVEVMQSLTAHADFSQHSFEELRVAYMLAGREIPSAEILATLATVMGSAAPAPPGVSPLQPFAAPASSPFAPPVTAAATSSTGGGPFGSTSSTTPTFSFGGAFSRAPDQPRFRSLALPPE